MHADADQAGQQKQADRVKKQTNRGGEITTLQPRVLNGPFLCLAALTRHLFLERGGKEIKRFGRLGAQNTLTLFPDGT